MPALSKATIVAQVFEAFSQVEGFQYSVEELNEFLSQSSFKMTSASQKKTSSDRKVSVYNCYLNDNKDTPIDERREDWKNISSDKESELYLKYQKMADDINASKNLPTKEEKKTKKLDKAKSDKAALQKQIEDLKKQVQNQTKSPESEPESEPEPEQESEQESEPESKPESKPEPEQESESEQESKSESEVNSDVEEQHDNERIDEPTDDSGIDSDEEEEVKFKPKFTGKNPDSATNNYKEWKKNQLGIDSSKSLSRFEYEKGKQEDNFNPKEYDDTCPWYNYIQDNMTVD